MSQPQKYEKTTTFANLKNVTQAFPQIDKELNNVATSINEIRDNLRIIQRDDGDVIITKNVEDALMQMAKDGVDTYGASISATANNANATANNAVVIANNAYSKADAAENTATNAVTTANESAAVVLDTVTSISRTQRDVEVIVENLPADISGEVAAKTANIPTLIQQAVDEAVVEKSGVTEETITTALGYKPASPDNISSLQEEVSAEAEVIYSSIDAVQGNLNTESQARIDADSAINTRIENIGNSLATVATTGSYDDLSNKPSIPDVPTNVSAFTNDAGYLTQHQSLAGYATTQQLSGYLPRSGGTMSGAITFASTQTFPSDDTKLDKSGGTVTGNLYRDALGKVFSLGKLTDIEGVDCNIDIGWDWSNGDGAGIGLRNSNATNPGEFIVYAKSGSTTEKILNGKSDGTLQWNKIDYTQFCFPKKTENFTVPASGGKITAPSDGWICLNGNFTYSSSNKYGDITLNVTLNGKLVMAGGVYMYGQTMPLRVYAPCPKGSEITINHVGISAWFHAFFASN